MKLQKFLRLFPTYALVVALLLVVLLSFENRSLKSRIATLGRRLTEPVPGSFVPAFPAITLKGDTVTLGAPADGGLQLLMFYTTTCPYCKATMPAWNRIASHAKRLPRLQVSGIQIDSTSSLEEFAADYDLAFPIARMTDRRFLHWLRINQVPQMLVVDSAGRMVYARGGELTKNLALDSVLLVLDSLSASATATVATSRQE